MSRQLSQRLHQYVRRTGIGGRHTHVLFHHPPHFIEDRSLETRAADINRHGLRRVDYEVALVPLLP